MKFTLKVITPEESYMKSKYFAIATFSILGLTEFASAGPLTLGPSSQYYLDDYNNSTIYVIQGTSVINSFAMAYGGSSNGFSEGMLAVTNTGVATNALYQYA